MSLTGEYEFEPVRGLPETLPEGETLLWQGAPDWRSLALHCFHVRAVTLYFTAIVVWRLASLVSAGGPAADIAGSAAAMTLLAATAVGLLLLLAWLIARSTVYSVTQRRVVIRFGVALPMTVNLPFSRIASAALRARRDGTGDIPLELTGDDRIAYLLLWPHARPWRFRRVEPMLRSVPEAAKVAALLAESLESALEPTEASPRAAPERPAPAEPSPERQRPPGTAPRRPATAA